MSLLTQERVLDYDAAARLVRDHAESVCRNRAVSSEKVDLLAARGRVLAEAVLADRDQPPFDRSTRDGFACRASDLATGRPLRVIGSIRAGQVWTGDAPGTLEAISIMTGAPVPHPMDCVVMIEKTQVSTDSAGPFIVPDRGSALNTGANIVSRGAEAQVGDIIIPPNTRLNHSHIGAAASCGCVALSVYRRPRVAILATGDELVDVSESPLPHQIRNSNSYSLAAQIATAGGEPVILPIVRDDAAVTEAAIREASGCELILLSGGVSVGNYDFVEQALAAIGAEFYFTGVRMQPGKPVVFGRLLESGKYFFGLPGNPLSTIVTFALFVQPLLSALSGAQERPRFLQAQLEESVKAIPGLTRFLPAMLRTSLEGSFVKAIQWQGSGDLASAARANCFLVVPPDRERLEAGDAAHILLS